MFEDLFGKSSSISSVTYAIVYEKGRTEFEKYWHVPFGYSDCELFNTFDEAYKFLLDNVDENTDEIKNYIIEEIVNGIAEIVYPEITDDGKRIYY